MSKENHCRKKKISFGKNVSANMGIRAKGCDLDTLCDMGLLHNELGVWNTTAYCIEKYRNEFRCGSPCLFHRIRDEHELSVSVKCMGGEKCLCTFLPRRNCISFTQTATTTPSKVLCSKVGNSRLQYLLATGMIMGFG